MSNHRQPAPLRVMGPLCSSAVTQVCHRSYIIAGTSLHLQVLRSIEFPFVQFESNTQLDSLKNKTGKMEKSAPMETK